MQQMMMAQCKWPVPDAPNFLAGARAAFRLRSAVRDGSSEHPPTDPTEFSQAMGQDNHHVPLIERIIEKVKTKDHTNQILNK